MGNHLDRANILLDLDKYDLAETALRQEIAENPDSDIAYGSLARCLINQRKLDSATLETIEYALSLNAENDWLHYLSAVYWHIKGEFNQAQQAIGIAIELDPNYALYFDTLARILFDRGNDNFKTHNWRILAILFVLSHGSLLPISWGISAIFRGYWLRSYLQPVAIPLAKSLALDPEYLSAINLQTQLLMETNRWHRALSSSLNALETDPSDITAHKLHAQILLRLGKYAAAVDHFQSSLRVDPSSKESKAGLLEAIRSQYWLYRWISITNWRGKLLLCAIIGIDILLVLCDAEAIFKIFTGLSFPIICVNLASKPIFNLLLQLNPKHKLVITSSVPIQNLIFGNYIASLLVAMIGLGCSLICSLVLPENQTAQNVFISILIVIAGVLISITTFLPVIDRRHFQSLSFIYPLIIGAVGLSNTIIYLSGNDINLLSQIFLWLVLLSPAFAIYSSRKTNH